MWMHILICLVLALQETKALSKKDCTTYDLTSDEERMVEIYCTRENVLAQKIVFGNVGDNRKFLVCTDVKSGCSGTCQNGGTFDKTTNGCGLAPIVCQLPSGVNTNIPLQPLDPFIRNPCSEANTNCYLFNHIKKNRFIICKRSTTQTPEVGQCMDGFEFSFTRQTCENQQMGNFCGNRVNPCKPIPENQKIINAGHLYFGCPSDPTKFIQCNKKGMAYIKPCRKHTVWSQKDLTCVSQ